MNQSIIQVVNHQTNQFINQSIHKSIIQVVNHQINQSINQSIIQQLLEIKYLLQVAKQSATSFFIIRACSKLMDVRWHFVPLV